jgi:membrane protein implicated in regulation of membrane protease activity
MLRRVLAVLVLVIVAAIAIRLVVGLVAGIVTAVLWVLVIAALVAAVLWARSTLKSGKRERSVKRRPPAEEIAAPAEDPVAAEMRRITEQLREQGRR